MDIPSGDGHHVQVAAAPGSSPGPQLTEVTPPGDSRGPAVDAPPSEPRTGGGIPPKPAA